MKTFILLIGVAAASALDALTTLIALHLELAREVNPLMDSLLNIGPTAFLVFKILFPPLLISILIPLKSKKVDLIAAFGLAAYLGIAFHNVFLTALRSGAI